MPMTRDRAAFVCGVLKHALTIAEQLCRELAAEPPTMTTPTPNSVALVATPQAAAAAAASPRVRSPAEITPGVLRGQAVDDVVPHAPSSFASFEQAALSRCRSRAASFTR